MCDLRAGSSLCTPSVLRAAPVFFLICATVLAAAIATAHAADPSTTPGSISPAKLEVNLGPLPIDVYDDAIANDGLIPSCSKAESVRHCVKSILGKYVRQKVTGVRFNFGLGGGYVNSTAFDAKGNVQAYWVYNLSRFFADLKSAGISKVTPTSSLGPDWSGKLQPVTAVYRAGHGCPKGSKRLLFYPWLPYGLDPTTHLPDGQGDNSAYACSPKNPIFWGWTPYFNLILWVASLAQSAGVTIEEFDIENEIDLWQFTAQARLLYDNTTSPPTPVLERVGQILAYLGFSSGAATYSVVAGTPASPVAACASVYGDSAYLMTASALAAAINGGQFGNPPYLALNGALPCDNSQSHCGSFSRGAPDYNPNWQACAAAGMITIPRQPQPRIVDIHVYPCIWDGGACQSVNMTGMARLMYDAVWKFLRQNRLTDNLLMIGETAAGAPTRRCDGLPPQAARQNAQGFARSTLRASHGANTVIRPWSQLIEADCPPVVIGSPTGAYAP
ncbi:MAG TPA: hypothetical protein VGF34_20425 [Stellaceae bacterium]|jgi:hypothetical protein